MFPPARALLFGVLISGGVAPAAMAVSFDFTTLGSDNTSQGTSVTVSGVKAEGLSYGSSTSPQGQTPDAVNLWLRNVTNDNGLGVCSETTDNCKTGGGDVNELSNQANNEAIRLTRPDGEIWDQLYVSSLDSGGTNGKESGRLFWSDSLNGFTDASSVTFEYDPGDCPVECNILAVIGVGNINPNAKYLLFMNDPTNGTNNDYLVWKGATIPNPGGGIPQEDVPEPATLALLGAGLLGLGLARRRRG